MASIWREIALTGWVGWTAGIVGVALLLVLGQWQYGDFNSLVAVTGGFAMISVVATIAHRHTSGGGAE